MLDAKYYKDLSHNYLILKGENIPEKNKYQNKMITGNRLKNLLPCSIRNINDETYFHYEISSMQSLESLYERNEIEYEQLYHLFECINEASEEVKEYLLEDNYLLLQAKYIYADPERERYFFIYYPCENTQNMTMVSFVQYLVDRVNHEEEKAVKIVYKIFELAQDDKFILPEVLKLFDEPVTEETNVKSRAAAEEEEIYYPRTEAESEIYDDGQEYYTENNTDRRGNMIISVILLFLCILAIIGIFSVRYFYVLSAEETILTVAGIITLVIIASFLLLYLIAFPARGRKKEKENVEAERIKVTTEIKLHPQDEYMEASASSRNTKSSRNLSAEGGNESTYGNTVFLETSLDSRENKLYGTSKGNKYHIDLNKLPCTVGKMAGSVDFVIKDNTVSRIHARFTREGDEICVTDLNSTNGTFKNGLRLEPNETMTVEQGDEIRFGKLVFCYR